MRSFRGTAPLIWQRFSSSWRLLTVLAFGMLVAATLLAASPVYTRVMNDLGLESSLNQRLGIDTRTSALQVRLPFGSAEAAAEAEAITRLLADETAWFTGAAVRYGSLPNLDYVEEGNPPINDPLRPLIAVQSLSDLDGHLRVKEGRLARPAERVEDLEVVVPAESARIFKLQPGDRIVAFQSFDDCNRLPPTNDPDELAARARFRCVPGVFLTLSATMTVAGIVEQADASDRYWSAGHASFAAPLQTETEGPILMVLMPEASYYGVLSSLLPRAPSLFEISSFADLGKIDSANLPRVRDSIATLRQRVEDHGALADTPMGFALNDFTQRASFNQVTLLLLLLQVVGIAIYYVILVSSLLVERRSEEVAMLRSRGASTLQVVGLAAAEAAILAAIVALVAPFLASGLVSLLGLTSTFETISGGGLLPFKVVPAAFLLGVAGAALAALAVVVPAFFTARQGTVVFLRGNARPEKPIMQRYYLDLGLAGLAALALWQVSQRGSVFDPRSVGGWSADPMLLLSPLLLIVAVGALMFRFLPPLLGLLANLLASRGGPASLTLGFWQLTRSPSRYNQLALLVVMAAAVGTFAATYGETTARSRDERARFQAGVDLRVNDLKRLEGFDADRIEQDLAAVPGVVQASAVLRSPTALGPLPTGGNPVELLALNPEQAASQVWFRDDFAGEGIESLMARLQGSPIAERGIDLGPAVAVSVWVNPSLPRPSTRIWLRTLDAAGFYRTHELGRLDFTGYQQLTASFAEDLDDIQYPLQLLGLMMTQPSLQDLTRGQMLVDDIMAIDAAGRETVIEDFEGAFRWDRLRTPTRVRDSLDRTNQDAHGGSGAARYSFLAGQSTAVRGIYVGDPNIPLPAIASSAFLALNGLRVGGEAEVVFGNVLMPVTIQGVVDYFPTMADTSTGFLIVNVRHLYSYASLAMQSIDITPNEAWLTLSPDPLERAAVYTALQNQFSISDRDIVDVEKLLSSINNDPLVRAGGSGVLLIALIASFAILALGFGLTLYLGGQARTIEVSVLRAVGLSPRQVFAMICLEYLLVAVIGLVVGTVTGLRISETMLDFLNVTETGDRLLPPFALTTRWDTVAIAFLATAVAFLVGIVALAGYFLRLSVSRVLRLTR